MSLPKDHRWIVVGSLEIRARKNAPNDAPDFVLGDLISAISDRIKKSKTHRDYSKENRLMWCDKSSDEGHFHKILIQVGNKNVAGFSFLNFDTHQTRDIEKEEEEGSHYSSHILIKKKKDSHRKHLILIEKVPGVSLSSIKTHFTWICNEVSYEKSSDDKKYRAFFDIDGYQSRTIRQALKSGVLQDIEFISNDENYADGLDEDGLIEEIVKEARWKIEKKVTDKQAKGLFEDGINFLKNFRKEDEDAHLYVRIKSDNGQIKRTEVDSENDVLEQAFIHNEMVSGFKTPLFPRCKDFRIDLISRMKKVATSLGN